LQAWPKRRSISSRPNRVKALWSIILAKQLPHAAQAAVPAAVAVAT